MPRTTSGAGTTLQSALAEAAYMTSLEVTVTMVKLASYAPLPRQQRHTQWLLI